MDRRRAVLVAVVSFGLVSSCAFGIGITASEPPAPGQSQRSLPSETSSTDSIGPSGVPPPACPAAARTTVAAPVPDRESATPRIVELYPNPTTYGNVGEYLVLETPPETRLENWTITDGHTTAALPNETVSGRVAVTLDPNVTAELTDESVLELEGYLRLAADGDTLDLRNGSATVDSVAYDRAPLAERWYRSDGNDGGVATEPVRGEWHPRGATCLPIATANVDEATAFVLPDAPGVPRGTIRAADERLLLAGYTITSEAIADDLVAAADRGVDVAVLFESGPVGGTPAPTEGVIETLEAAAVDVRVIGGEGARYRYHHPKYAVADDRILVTSENWKPSGVGGTSSRGWGVRLEDESLAAELAAVFRADHGGWDTETGSAFRTNTSFVDDESAAASSRSLPTVHEPATVPVDEVELLLAPDNAEDRLIELIGEADDEILVKQASIDRDVSMLDAVIEAARRGIEVRILLDSTWYHEDDNRALADDLESLADDESLPLAVRLVEDTDRFEKIHAKGVVIDRETAIVGSANWNANAFENNREVLVALHGDEIATYYATVFEDDWDGGTGLWTIPFGLGITVVAALAVAALVGRRCIRFDEQR